MRSQLFILNPDGTVREAANRQEFLAFMEDARKKVLVQNSLYGMVQVTTNFLGKVPLVPPSKRSAVQLFETVVQGGVIDGSVRRYDTYQDAMEGHQQIVRLVQNSIN